MIIAVTREKIMLHSFRKVLNTCSRADSMPAAIPVMTAIKMICSISSETKGLMMSFGTILTTVSIRETEVF